MKLHGIIITLIALLCCVLVTIPLSIKYNELLNENKSLKSQVESNEAEYHEDKYYELINGTYDSDMSDDDESLLRHVLYLYDKLGYDYDTDYYTGDLDEY